MAHYSITSGPTLTLRASRLLKLLEFQAATGISSERQWAGPSERTNCFGLVIIRASEAMWAARSEVVYRRPQNGAILPRILLPISATSARRSTIRARAQ